MDSFGAARKRGRADAANGNGSKRMRELDVHGLGSKSKPCTKFFSTAGCPFGEGCHFLHYVPGGFNPLSHQMGSNMGNPALAPPPSRGGPMGPSPPIQDPHGPPPMKTKMCNKYNTAEGCKFGDKCHFAHGDKELGKSIVPSHHDRMPRPHMGGPGRMGGPRFEPPPPPSAMAPPASFGASATAKISVDGSLAGAIIGKGGINTKHICRVTGAKLAIRDHESNENLKNIELEGSYDQISNASKMVQDLIRAVSANAPMPMKAHPPVAHSHAPPAAHGGSNFKTKLCDNFAKGTCTFGDRCHFAHGANELRKAAV